MVISKFNQQTGVLESEFKGEVTLSEVVNYILATKDNKTYPRVLKIRTNAANSDFNFSRGDLEAIVNANNQSLEQYDAIIDAIIVENPKTTMLSMLYQKLGKNDKYVFNIFSTEKGASQWLENYQ